MLTYSLDSSAIIQAWNYWYTHDLHHDFWASLEELGEEGRLLVSAEVLAELSNNGTRTNDPVYRWCKDREDMISVPSDRAIQTEVSRLVNEYTFGGTGVPGSKDFADPFVVAVARLRNARVICHEARKKPKQTNLRIPDVCIKEGIPWSPVYRIILNEKWKFKRA